MIIASPRPNKNRPIINIVRVINLGLVFSGRSELQLTDGTLLIVKILVSNRIYLLNYGLNYDKSSLWLNETNIGNK